MIIIYEYICKSAFWSHADSQQQQNPSIQMAQQIIWSTENKSMG